MKFAIAVWFFALLLNAFSTPAFAATLKSSPATVYCPLTKKLQPVKIPQARPNPLGEICANEKDKQLFTNEFFGVNRSKINFLSETQFENLVFDFFRKGESAFAGLPSLPDSPHQKSIVKSFLIYAFGKINEYHFAFKTNDANFSFAQNPRPPNSRNSAKLDFQIARELRKISRRINPRSPPFSI